MHPTLCEKTLAVLQGRGSRFPALRSSSLGEEAQLLGAVGLAARHVASDLRLTFPTV